MAKVFRIHEGASDTISGWSESTKIGSKAIDSIKDPIGAVDSKEITSVPSPFARMELVKRAFRIVAEGELDGKTIYHKLVSDALDVGQIFFNYEKYRDFIEIIVWDKVNDLNLLKNDSTSPEHVRMGKTLQTYMEQDDDEYHFSKMDCIYLLNYIGEGAPNEMNIIGATSPATLFFTSANDLSYVSKKVKFGRDLPFDGGYMSLYKRDFEYIKFWWSLYKGFPQFAVSFPEVEKYLNACFKELNNSQKVELRSITSADYSQHYDDIPIRVSAQNYVSVLNQKLRQKRVNSNAIVNSDFVMAVTQNTGKRIPLALPVTTFSDKLIYVTDEWNKNTKVPFIDNTSIDNRILPDDGTQYPYVTSGDFLEDVLIKIPYKFNKDHFFNGNDNDPEAKSFYLLPLKKCFFDYFKPSDLKGCMIDGKKMFEIKRLPSQTGASVTLRVPIKRGYIQYEKIYYSNTLTADPLNNKGIIKEREFTVCLYPAIKYDTFNTNKVQPYYRVAVLDRDSVATNQDNQYTLSFYRNDNEVLNSVAYVERNKSDGGHRIDSYTIDSATYLPEDNFDYIKVEDKTDCSISGLIIPLFLNHSGNKKFRFAIDFGTTNTHIEYSIDGQEPKAFDITLKDRQIIKLHDEQSEDNEIRKVLDADFVPSIIGGNSPYSYPMRTVLSECNRTDWRQGVLSMAHTNISFTYEKSKILPYNNFHTNLKWSAEKNDNERVKQYIECLLLLLRNKVLMNNGDISATEIIWFYPASMTEGRFDRFRTTWENIFAQLFNAPEENIICMPESIAPFFHHKSVHGATSTVVSIDIGGGTTDVLIADNRQPKYLTSFRFAANSIFGDGYSYNADSNGFVSQYAPIIEDKLSANNLGALLEVMESVMSQKRSADIIAFFFSLANNKEVNEKNNLTIDFNGMLADDKRGKYVFLLFYVAIIYHIATLMKAKKISMPRFITFSGNGSKMLDILSSSKKTLEEFTKVIFSKVYEKTYPEDGLEIIIPKDAKESTCKGGIRLSPFKTQEYSSIRDLKSVLLGIDEVTFSDSATKYSTLGEVEKEKVVENVKQFLGFVFDLDSVFPFHSKFDVDSSIMNEAKKTCYRDLRNFLDTGIDLMIESIKQDGARDDIEETLFFYPLAGVLNALAREIYKI